MKFFLCTFILILFLGLGNTYGQPVIIRSQAGNDTSGFTPFARFAELARINAPGGVAVDKYGNLFFTNDSLNVVQKVTPDGHLSVFAGRTDAPGFFGDGGPATAAGLKYPLGLAFDKNNNLYIADNGNYAIRKVDTNGIITTFAGIGGLYGCCFSGDGHHADSAQINCVNLAFDKIGNLYFTDYNVHLRKIDTNGVITTYAGGASTSASGTVGNGGLATAAAFGNITGVAADSNGNVYVSDILNHVIRKIKPNDTIVAFAGTSIAGFTGDNGLATAAKLNTPYALAVDKTGYLYVTDKANNRIRRISLTTDSIKTVVGNGTAGFSCEGCVPTSAAIKTPSAIAFGGEGMFIADAGNFCVREVFPTDTLKLTSDHGNIRDTVCFGYPIVFHAAVLHQGYGDTLAWYKNSTWIHGNDTTLFWNTFNNNDTIKCVMYAPGGGVQVLASNKIIVTVLPSPAPISGPSYACPGTTTATFTDTTSGGHWIETNPSVGMLDSTGILTIIGPGVDTIKYGHFGTCLALFTYSVNPPPPPILGPPSVCLGVPVSLGDIPGGIWATSDTTIATINPVGTIIGLVPGSVIVTYTATTHCTATMPVMVYPNPAPIAGIDTICSRSTFVFTDSTPGGIWITSNPTVATIDTFSGSLIAISPGADTLTYILPTGCRSTTSTVVLYTPAPINGLVSGTQIICRGSTLTVTDADTTGIWSSSDSAALLIDDSGRITGLILDTVTIAYTISNGCAATLTYAVDSVPDAITGSMSVCMGYTTNLFNSAASGIWTTTGYFTQIADSTMGGVTGMSVGVDTIQFTITSGCNVTRSITVYPLPSPILGTDSACAGTLVSLNDTTADGVWSVANTVIAGISADGIVNGNITGYDSVLYTIPTGCSSVLVFQVRSSPLPITLTGPACLDSGSVAQNLVTGGIWNLTNHNASVDSISGAITGLLSGTDTLSYTLPSGCFVTSAFTVNANPGAITGSNVVCAGNQTVFADTVPGGTWTTSDTSIGLVSGSGVATGLSAGLTTVWYTLTNGCHSVITLSVNPIPEPIAGAISLCTGVAVAFIDMTGTGMWSHTGTGLGSIDTTGQVADTMTGVDTIFYTLPITGCFTKKIVTVNQSPAIVIGMNALCYGATSIYTDSATGGVWTSTDSLVILPDSSGNIHAAGTGTAGLVYTLTDGCYRNIMVTVNPVPNPIIGSDSVCVGSSVTLNEMSLAGSWTSSHLLLATVDTTGIVHGLANGADTIFYTINTTGCNTAFAIRIDPLPAPITGLPIVCTGDSTILHEISSGGYWATSDNSKAGINAGGTVYGLVADSVNIAYILPTGCRTSIRVAVDSTPVTITGGMYFCTGHTYLLTDTTAGGSWTSINNGIATIDSTGTIQSLTAGNDTIIYSLPTGCLTRAVVTVNPSPASITGNQQVCFHGINMLGDITGGGNWSSGDTLIASVNELGGVYGYDTGITSISYTIANQCSTVATVTVEPVPFVPAITLHSAPSLCLGTQYQNFGTDTVVVGATLNWTADNASVWAQGVAHQYALVNFPDTGTAVITLSVMESGYGCTGFSTYTVTVGSTPTDTGAVIYLSGSFFCTNSLVNYQWGYDQIDTLNPTILVGEVNQNYYNATPDFVNNAYWVMMYDGSCEQKIYYNTPTKLTNTGTMTAGALQIYPNPTSGGRFTISLPESGNIAAVEVYDLLGNKIEITYPVVISGDPIPVALKNVAAGIYIVKAICGSQVYVGRIEVP